MKENQSAIKGFKKKPVYSFIKRALDIFFSVLALILLSPFFLIVAIWIKVDDPKGSVFFSHKRVGKNGKVISILKFRTMVENAEELIKSFTPEQKAEFEANFKLENDPRITKVGNILRKTSLDELPQFFNILKGDMSFVGPRPPIPREVEQYDEAAMKRLDIVGGLTCYWQVMGRSSIEFDGMVSLDLKYIEERSFLTDLKILFMTVPAVLKGDGAY